MREAEERRKCGAIIKEEGRKSEIVGLNVDVFHGVGGDSIAVCKKVYGIFDESDVECKIKSPRFSGKRNSTNFSFLFSLML